MYQIERTEGRLSGDIWHIAALGLEARAWCSSCKSWGRIDPSDPRWSGRRFAGARLRCQKRRYDGVPCGGFGHLSIVPPERINPASAIERVHLACGSCVPSWEILDVRLGRSPWSTITLGKGDCFRCPGCRGVVMWHSQGGSSAPFSEGYRT